MQRVATLNARQSVFAFAALKLRRTRFAFCFSRGCATRSPKGEAWWARQLSNNRFPTIRYQKVRGFSAL
jgi:hypothetical protein